MTREEPLRFEQVSEGLRRALEEGREPNGRHQAAGVGRDGKLYQAVGTNDLRIREWDPIAAVVVWIPEPEGVIWKPILPRDKWLKLEEISAGLRRALEATRWPFGRDGAAGIGPEGTEYRAWMRYDDASLRRVVSIGEVIAGTALAIPHPEPEGIFWKPTFNEKEWVRLASVSDALRTALAESRSPSDLPSVTGVGPDGLKYRAHVWHEDLVFIDYWGMAATRWSRRQPPLPEPEGVVWHSQLPETSLAPPPGTARRRPWWRFWK